jgi:hypothetical protein
MEAQQITVLFAAAGLSVELIHEGPPLGCPYCDEVLVRADAA